MVLYLVPCTEGQVCVNGPAAAGDGVDDAPVSRWLDVSDDPGESTSPLRPSVVLTLSPLDQVTSQYYIVRASFVRQGGFKGCMKGSKAAAECAVLLISRLVTHRCGAGVTVGDHTSSGTDRYSLGGASGSNRRARRRQRASSLEEQDRG